MNVLVVYESMFGNTERVARAIAEGLATRARVEVAVADELTDERIQGFDAMVVGAPTHAFGLPKASTRRQAMQQVHRPADVEVGLRERLDALHPWAGMPTAAFATRIRVRGIPSRSAAKTISKKLRRLGCAEVARPEAFLVDGTQGPLKDGELDRARRWGAALAGAIGEPGRAAA